nr:reverse transcriptase domain-containing protein [Tanacetum cinerariifolium]
MPPKRTSTSVAPAMIQAAIRQLVTDSITTALEVQADNMENVDNTSRNPKPREAHVARKCSYKEFMSYQAFNFKGSEGAVGLFRWFEREISHKTSLKRHEEQIEEILNHLDELSLDHIENTEDNIKGLGKVG